MEDHQSGSLRDPNHSYEFTEIVDPKLNNGQNGVVSSVILDFIDNVWIRRHHAPLLYITGRLDVSDLELFGSKEFNIEIGHPSESLTGSLQPVSTLLTVGSRSVQHVKRRGLKINVERAKKKFYRGDANIDGEVDVSDAIKSLKVLFLGGEEFSCEDAADTNDDGSLDISDPIATLGYLFLGDFEIPSPFPDRDFCRVDPTDDDDLRCDQYIRSCFLPRSVTFKP